jgi:type IV pilus assembly protein PilX
MMTKLKSTNSQAGAALFVGIILLIILSLFVLGAMRDVLLQERMAGAYRNSSMAENVVDSLQRDAHRQLFDDAIANGGSAPDLGSFANEVAGRNDAAKDFRLSVGYPAAAGNKTPNAVFVGTGGDKLSKPGAIMVEGAISIKSNSETVSQELQSQLATVNGGGNFDLVAYRITSKGTGGSDEFVRAAETTYVVASSRTGQ